MVLSREPVDNLDMTDLELDSDDMDTRQAWRRPSNATMSSERRASAANPASSHVHFMPRDPNNDAGDSSSPPARSSSVERHQTMSQAFANSLAHVAVYGRQKARAIWVRMRMHARRESGERFPLAMQQTVSVRLQQLPRAEDVECRSRCRPTKPHRRLQSLRNEACPRFHTLMRSARVHRLPPPPPHPLHHPPMSSCISPSEKGGVCIFRCFFELSVSRCPPTRSRRHGRRPLPLMRARHFRH